VPNESDPTYALLETMGEAVYVVDHGRRITYWNRAAERLTGFPAAEVVGRRCRDGILNHVDDARTLLCRYRCPLLATMRDGQPRQAFVFLHHRDGHRVPVAISAAALRDADGRVLGAVEVFRDDSRFRDIADQLDAAQCDALTDPLTGLGNRRMLQRELKRHHADHRRYARPFAVLFADIDNFKKVNDSHGHDAGDKVLQLVAVTLAHCIRPGDAVGRWGGEEFLILAPVSGREQAVMLAERVRNLTASGWIAGAHSRISVTISVGVAIATDGEPATSLVARADAALLAAKTAGKNRIAVG
jgi:diguanylate cyclase (GGDEF)-like protein/PAS domain S-box-containing protein